MTTALVERPTNTAIEQVLIKGDLSGLTEPQRLAHYRNVCESLGLNPLTTPFDYLKLNGKTILYAKRDAAEQLRKIHRVSITDIQTQHFGDVYIVTAKAHDKTGRMDASTGVVPLGSLKGEALANALMKAETKAKRRVTLSICGLGMLDETEVESIPGAAPQGYTVTAPTALAPAGPQPEAEGGFLPSEPNGGDSAVLDLPEGAVTVVSVEMRPTKNANVKKYVAVLSDGREVATIREQIGVLAESFCQEGVAVTVETKDTKWGTDLVAIHRVATGERRCDVCGRLVAECVCDQSAF